MALRHKHHNAVPLQAYVHSQLAAEIFRGAYSEMIAAIIEKAGYSLAVLLTDGYAQVGILPLKF